MAILSRLKILKKHQHLKQKLDLAKSARRVVTVSDTGGRYKPQDVFFHTAAVKRVDS